MGRPSRARPGPTLKGSAPPWANKANLAGPADANEAVGFRVYLGWVDPDGAVALAKAVSDPRSASYGKYLTANQFRSRFAPSAADTAKVQNWLRAQGFDVQYTPKNNHYISAEGTVAQLQAAFNVQFAMYNVRGATVRAPIGDVSVPAQIAATVNGVFGLDESAFFVRPYARVDKDAPPSDGFRNAPPLSDYWAAVRVAVRLPRRLHRRRQSGHGAVDGQGLYARPDQGRLRHLGLRR